MVRTKTGEHVALVEYNRHLARDREEWHPHTRLRGTEGWLARQKADDERRACQREPAALQTVASTTSRSRTDLGARLHTRECVRLRAPLPERL